MASPSDPALRTGTPSVPIRNIGSSSDPARRTSSSPARARADVSRTSGLRRRAIATSEARSSGPDSSRSRSALVAGSRGASACREATADVSAVRRSKSSRHAEPAQLAVKSRSGTSFAERTMKSPGKEKDGKRSRSAGLDQKHREEKVKRRTAADLAGRRDRAAELRRSLPNG